MPTLLFGSLSRRPLLVVALLTAALLAALPAVASAQNPDKPQRLYWGANDTVTVDGQPWDGSQIDVIDEDGNVVATLERESMSWSVEISNEVDSFRFRASNGSLSELYSPPEAAVMENFVLTIGGPERTTREVALLTGWNWVVWTGHTQSIADALETFPDTSQLTAMFEFIPVGQKLGSYRPGLPAVAAGHRRTAGRRRLLPPRRQCADLGDAHRRRSDRHTGRSRRASRRSAGWGPTRRRRRCWTRSPTRAPLRAFFRFNAALQTYESYRFGVPAFAQ